MAIVIGAPIDLDAIKRIRSGAEASALDAVVAQIVNHDHDVYNFLFGFLKEKQGLKLGEMHYLYEGQIHTDVIYGFTRDSVTGESNFGIPSLFLLEKIKGRDETFGLCVKKTLPRVMRGGTIENYPTIERFIGETIAALSDPAKHLIELNAPTRF